MLPRGSRPRSYGTFTHRVQRFAGLAIATLFWALAPAAATAADRPVKIVVFGDSLTAGYGLAAQAAFPARLAAALKTKGIAVTIANAGVSGDTASGGLSRLDWSVPEDTDAVILEFGGNDALRGMDPAVTKAALNAMLKKLHDRHIAVLLAGMKAPPNMGPDYVKAFNAIFPSLASTHSVVFYPFFLDGVVGNAGYNLLDGIHPNPAGVDIIVARIVPYVEKLIARVRATRGS